MKNLSGQYYIEEKDHRYNIHPTEKTSLRKRDPPKPLGTQYQVQNETQIRKNQKFIKNDNKELEVENYPKKTNHLPNNQNLNHQFALLANKTIRSNLIKNFVFKIVNILSTDKNIRQTK